MYTPLGYMPDDLNLPFLDDFYTKCEREGVPVIVHCSNGGMFTHDWKYYLDLEKDSSVRNNYIKLESFYKELNTIFDWERRSRPLDYKTKLPQVIAAHSEGVTFLKKHDCVEEMDDQEIQEYIVRRYEHEMKPFDARREYFTDFFINPRAWRKVLEKHPELKICFAHFGGDQWAKGDLPNRKGLECQWIQEIISLINDYKNVYTDISYFNTKSGPSGYTDEFKKALKEFLREEEHSLRKEPQEREKSILDRILWGTDWYMTEIDNLHYDDHCSDMKKICDDSRFEGSWKTLYIRFTMVNPVEFFRLGEIADNFNIALQKNLYPAKNHKEIKNIDCALKKLNVFAMKQINSGDGSITVKFMSKNQLSSFVIYVLPQSLFSETPSGDLSMEILFQLYHRRNRFHQPQFP